MAVCSSGPRRGPEHKNENRRQKFRVARAEITPEKAPRRTLGSRASRLRPNSAALRRRAAGGPARACSASFASDAITAGRRRSQHGARPAAGARPRRANDASPLTPTKYLQSSDSPRLEQGPLTKTLTCCFYPYNYPLTEPTPANTGPNTPNPVVSKPATRGSTCGSAERARHPAPPGREACDGRGFRRRLLRPSSLLFWS